MEGAGAGQNCLFSGIIFFNTQSSQAHFTANQVQFILNKKPELKENKNCRRLYLELRKHFGIKQKYSELIMLCKNCRYSLHSSKLSAFSFKTCLGVFSGHPTDILVLPVPIPTMLQYRSLLAPFCLSLMSRLAAIHDSYRIHSVQTSRLYLEIEGNNQFKSI